jgi:hypothetical protein
MTKDEIIAELVNLGVPSQDAQILAAVGTAESGLNTNAVGDNGDSIGMFQINMPAHKSWLKDWTGSSDESVWEAWLKVPANNLKAAAAVYKSQQLGAWTCFNNGSYLPYYTSSIDSTTSGSAAASTTKKSFSDWYLYFTGQSTDSPWYLQQIPGTTQTSLVDPVTGEKTSGSVDSGSVGSGSTGIMATISTLFSNGLKVGLGLVILLLGVYIIMQKETPEGGTETA